MAKTATRYQLRNDTASRSRCRLLRTRLIKDIATPPRVCRSVRRPTATGDHLERSARLLARLGGGVVVGALRGLGGLGLVGGVGGPGGSGGMDVVGRVGRLGGLGGLGHPAG